MRRRATRPPVPISGLTLGGTLGLTLLVGACGDDTTSASDSASSTIGATDTGDGDGDPGDGDPGDGDGDPGDGDPGDGDPGDGDGDGDPGDGDGDGDPGDGDGDGDPPPPFVPFDPADWARGDIGIDRVEVNQGVAIEVVSDGQLIPVEQRIAGLVKDRNTLIQVFWSIPPGWQARPILAKLHLRDTEGALSVVEVTKTISGAPTSGSLNGPLTFSLPAQQFVGNTEFFIELWEGEGGHENLPASSASPSAPAGGMQAIGVTTEPMEAKIVLVPVQYDHGNCHTNTTNVINNNFDAFYDWFFAQNPIHSLDMTIREGVLVQDTQLVTLSQINGALVGLRFTDFAEPNVYYHAVVNACAGGVDGAGGLAPGLPGPIKGAGDLRVSTTLWVDLGFTRNAFVHELGHNQGRPHSPCGGPDGADDNYPHAGAGTGAWGFNILSFNWYNPNNNYKDYMSYCNPTWVSDWTWGKVHEQVRQLTSWDYAGSVDADDDLVEILHGWVHPSGLEQWWTSLGSLEARALEARSLEEATLAPSERVRFYGRDGELIAEHPAASWMLDDGQTRYFMVELPAASSRFGPNNFASIERLSGADVHDIPRQTITRHVVGAN
jgi:hypothetical protein